MSTATVQPYATYEVQQQVKPKGLDGLSEKLLDQHWKLYEGYVTNSNLLNKAIWETLDSGAELNKPNTAELQRRLGFEYNGMVLHEYYFGALKAGGQEPGSSSSLAQKLAKDFGSLERWKKQFIEIGKMRGIGWVITKFDPLSQRLINFWTTDHEMGNIAGFIPVVVMDVWEHAYITDFGALAAGRGEYINTYFRNLNWDIIAKRLDLASQGKLAPRNLV